MKKILLFTILLNCSVCTKIYSKTIVLTPYDHYEEFVPLAGSTCIRNNQLFRAIAIWRDLGEEPAKQLINEPEKRVKNFLLFSCLETLERGKIFNITDNEIVVHLKYYYPHDVFEEEIVVKPQTFSRITSGGWPQKIVCTF